MEYILKKYNINFQVNFDKDIELKTNEMQLLQIMSVIITNAKDAFVENNTSEPKIVVTIYEENSLINISISNNAGAIDPLIKDKIFEPYYSTKNNSEGTGLGLYITKLIVETKLNSSILVRTDKEWTTFIIKLTNVLQN